MPRQTHTAFARELAKQDAAMAQVFLEAVQNITSSAQIAIIDAAISRGDVQGVVAALNIGPDIWAPLDDQITRTFIAGALWQQDQFPKKATPAGVNLRIGFNQRNPRAEQWTRQRAGELITEINENTRLGARRVITEGLEQNLGVKRIRNNLIGALQGNQRKGGIIGLHSSQVDAVIKARAELSDPATLKAYLQRVGGAAPGRSTVNAAINAGRPLTADEIDRVARVYSDRLLQVRGQRIARTEAHNAFQAGSFEATQQHIDKGNIPASAVTMIWQATVGSARTRDSHRSMNSQTVPFGTPFTSPRGAQLMHPGDTSLGAPGAETINCRCSSRPVISFESLAI